MGQLRGRVSLEVSGGQPGGLRPLFFINHAQDTIPWLDWEEGDDGIWRSGRGTSLVVLGVSLNWELSLDESGPSGSAEVRNFLTGPKSRPALADDYLADPSGNGTTAGSLRDLIWQQNYEFRLIVAAGQSFSSGDANIQNPTQGQLLGAIQLNQSRLDALLAYHYGPPRYCV